MPKSLPDRLSPRTNLSRHIAVYAMNSLDPKTGAWTPTAIASIEIAETLFRPHLLVVQMEDDGMEPVIRRQAYVGLDRDDVTARSGEIYALDISGEGLVIKRLEPDIAGKRLRLVSASSRHAERFLAQGGPDYLVIGRVVWVIQDL
ncbi:S24 family peptidase [Solidesulfovibrio carbinolicus]|uniref:Transcriptional regulator n=1 Tax=Solidesulfovibrio carbinolicus TaxID=296842 RepID=A0A4P6HLC6_9BACT|nr:S24/S26 family peptidase [Solidesulfovibrio carbinolicus]QAZ67785.1 transcriptional regulator [Solidesulfovibrio carbinolicus]